MLADNIQHHILEEVQHSLFVKIRADSTTVVSACKQFSCNLQFVDVSLALHNVFLGLCTVPDLRGQTLFLSVENMFIKQNLPLVKLQSHYFEGDSNISGELNGVQAKLKNARPNALLCTPLKWTRL